MTAAHGSSPDRGLIWLDEPLVETLAWQPAARPEAWITALAYTENTENIPTITKHYQTLQNKKGNLKRHVNATWTPPFLVWTLRRPNLRNLLHKLLRISIQYIHIFIHNVSHIHLASPYIPSKALWSCPSIPRYSDTHWLSGKQRPRTKHYKTIRPNDKRSALSICHVRKMQNDQNVILAS